MSEKFTITPLDQLLKIILNQIDKNRLFGVPSELFFKPELTDPFRLNRYGQLLETPIGVAAGPHTQLSQNIVIAWLMGARYIELKTIQTLDELNVSKPCIDMQDEGYNCEWSQELKVHESFEQYLDAWIIIHVIRHKFNFGISYPGVIFNMSVGYDYEGIQNENVQWFLNKMSDASDYLKQKLESIKSIYPEITELDINPCISNNITLSTMHGCPVDEIEKIGKYLVEDRKLHTTIKLNPTLLGRNELNEILNNSGFKTNIPDSAFDHDPKFEQMVSIIRNLEKSAKKSGVHFGLKLTNTLESKNHKNTFPSSEEMMYLSGRALHPISIKVARKLQNKFDGKLDISFCAGVDAFNISDVISCGLYPITVCSDILKPGGYGRLSQYIEQLRLSFNKTNSGSITEFIEHNNQTLSFDEAALLNLKNYARKVVEDVRYKKTAIREPNIKTDRKLSMFDCVNAPCVDTCPTNQDIPDYLYYTSKGQIDKAQEVILKTNPFPRTTGMICDHPCQLKCTLINYNDAVQIRGVKRYISENAQNYLQTTFKERQKKVAIIGAGPSGLSCAWFLEKAGFEVTIFETKSKPGGMVSAAIPEFRVTDNAIEADINQIEALGVKISYNIKIDKPFFSELKRKNDIIYLAMGAQSSVKLNIEKIDAKGVIDPLQFLYNTKAHKSTGIGKHVVIIGGGNTAMDAARTAYRLVGEKGTVTIIYRRTINQMPADTGEIKAVLDEGMEIIELASPLKVNVPATSVAATSNTKQNPVPATSVTATSNTKQNPVPATSVAATSNTKQNPVPATSVAATSNTKQNPVPATSVAATSNTKQNPVPATSVAATSNTKQNPVPATSVTDKGNSFSATEVAGTVQSLTCIKMIFSGVDNSGRPRPVPIPGSEFTIKCDTIIPAIGQELSIDFLDPVKLMTNPGSYETQLKNVFIGGDAMRGASTAINAIGDGRKVAETIINKANLNSSSNNVVGRTLLDLNEHLINRSKRTSQVQATENPLSDRKNFKLISSTFTEAEAIHEASRCLLCDEFCSICATVCPNLAFHTYKVKPLKYNLQKIFIEDKKYDIVGEKLFEISQPYQILHIADWCNKCGNCTTFCPTSGIPYEDKPHLYLNKKSFDDEKDGYFLNRSSANDIIYFKKGNHSSMLASFDDHFLYKSDETVVKLEMDAFKLIAHSTGKKGKFEIDLQEAVEMNVIMHGAKSFFE